jgi:hypothetical protein
MPNTSVRQFVSSNIEINAVLVIINPQAQILGQLLMNYFVLSYAIYEDVLMGAFH